MSVKSNKTIIKKLKILGTKKIKKLNFIRRKFIEIIKYYKNSIETEITILKKLTKIF